MTDSLPEDHAGPASWDDLRGHLAQQEAWSLELLELGQWALKIWEEELGPGWPNAWLSGGLPAELAAAPGSVPALVRVIELAVALRSVTEVAGAAAVRKALKSRLARQQLVAPRTQIRLAAAALRAGLGVHIEPKRGGVPADLAISDGTTQIVIELLSILVDDRSLEASSWSDQLTYVLTDLGQSNGLDFTVEVDWPAPDAEQTHEILDRVQSSLAVVAAGLDAAPVVLHGVAVEMRPAKSGGGCVKLRMPAVNCLKRWGNKIQKKKIQTRRSGATWLIVDSHDHLWSLTPWSQGEPAARLEELAQVIRGMVDDAKHLHGALITDGGTSATSFGGDDDLDLHGANCVRYVRRRIDPYRRREALIVPLNAQGVVEAELLARALNAEPAWLDYLPGPRPTELVGAEFAQT
jgi:hypothetical protein